MSESGPYLMLNGRLHPAEEPILKAGNRAFQYGDGLFETLRVIRGTPCFLDHHLARVTKGGEVLGIIPPPEFTVSALRASIQTLLRENGVTQSGRLRLTLFRERGGTYRPEGDRGEWLAEIRGWDGAGYEWNEMGKELGDFPDIPIHKTPLSPFKTTNALVNVMASLRGRKKGWDDCLLWNSASRPVETTSSNVFAVFDGELYTPPLGEGCVDGVMRHVVLGLAAEWGVVAHEAPLGARDLLGADEVFLTNAVKGIQWVERYRSAVYGQRIAKGLMARLNEKVRGETPGALEGR